MLWNERMNFTSSDSSLTLLISCYLSGWMFTRYISILPIYFTSCTFMCERLYICRNKTLFIYSIEIFLYVYFVETLQFFRRLLALNVKERPDFMQYAFLLLTWKVLHGFWKGPNKITPSIFLLKLTKLIPHFA